MLRQDPASSNAKYHSSTSPVGQPGGSDTLDVQQELNHLEEMILDGTRVLFTGRTLIDEDQLLEQLDRVRLGLPESFRIAEEILQRKREIMTQAEEYAQDIIEQARQQAAQILNESGIIQQAQRDAQQIHQHVHQECQSARSQTMAEIDQLRQQAKQELDAMRHQVITECDDLQREADRYADHVLKSMEQQMGESLRVIRNGRQQLQAESSLRNREFRDTNGMPPPTAPQNQPPQPQPSGRRKG